MIKKPTIIISSGGRTGTTFFSNLLSEALDDCIALHEPGAIKWKTRRELTWMLLRFGFFNITVKKLFQWWGISSISNKRIYGKITDEQATAQLMQQRQRFIDELDCKVYVESSYHYYGVIEILPRVFQNLNVVYLVRHGYDWVRSHINKKDWYTGRDIHRLWGMRIAPRPHDGIYFHQWKSMSHFQKVCWSWLKINSCALKSIEETPEARLFRFEDILQSEKKYENMKALLDFATSFPTFTIPYRSIEGSLEKRINKPPSYDFPNWSELPENEKRQFTKICGPLMHRLGYEVDY